MGFMGFMGFMDVMRKIPGEVTQKSGHPEKVSRATPAR
jgi:hypothetical protein